MPEREIRDYDACFVDAFSCTALAFALALVPFAALFRVAHERQQRRFRKWQDAETLRRELSDAEIIQLRVALDPGVRHVIWTSLGGERRRTTAPPLRDQSGRRVDFAPGTLTFYAGPGDRVELTHDPTYIADGLDFTPAPDRRAYVIDDDALFVQARAVDRGTSLMLAPVNGTYVLQSSADGFARPVDARPCPALPLRLPILAIVALSTTSTPLLFVLVGLPNVALAAIALCPLAVLGVTARARDIVWRIEQWFDPKCEL